MTSGRRLLPAALIAAVIVTGCDRRPEPRSLAAMDSHMTVRTDVPETRMTVLEAGGGAGGGAPESGLAPAGAQSLFREAEIAPGRIEETRLLLGDLHARQAEDRSIRFDLPADILFDFDKATLRPDAAQGLEKAARLLANYPDASIAVAGHTDARGDDAYNDALSKRRAGAVADWLEQRTDRTAEVRGFGKRRPIAPNTHDDGSDDPEGRQRNRRVEIIILPS
ncbi:MAG: OmpA family protein [Sphingomonas bacterium]